MDVGSVSGPVGALTHPAGGPARKQAVEDKWRSLYAGETGKARFLGEAVQLSLSSLATGKAHAKLRALRAYLKSR